LHTKPDLDVEKVEMGVANNTQLKRVSEKKLEQKLKILEMGGCYNHRSVPNQNHPHGPLPAGNKGGGY